MFILEISSVSYTPHFSVSLLSLLFGEKVWALDELLYSIFFKKEVCSPQGFAEKFENVIINFRKPECK